MNRVVGAKKGDEEIITKGHWETFASDKHVNFYDYSDSSTINLQIYALHVCI